MFFTPFFELSFTGLFLVFCLKYIRDRETSLLLELLSAATYGLTLEFMSIVLFSSYQYSTGFVLQFREPPENVPIVIALSWGMIILSSMRVTDSFGFAGWVRPFSDTLVALTIDLAMDAVAIRIEGGFWSWEVPVQNAITIRSYFGVIYGNYIGWFFIILIFTSFLRAGRRHWGDRINVLRLIYTTLIPFLAYIPLYIALKISGNSKYYLELFLGRQLPLYFPALIMVYVLASLVMVVLSKGDGQGVPVDRLTKLLFVGFHTYFLFYQLVSLLWLEVPLLTAISVAVLSLDLWLVHRPVLGVERVRSTSP